MNHFHKSSQIIKEFMSTKVPPALEPTFWAQR
jgi:hypothetical protein